MPRGEARGVLRACGTAVQGWMGGVSGSTVGSAQKQAAGGVCKSGEHSARHLRAVAPLGPFTSTPRQLRGGPGGGGVRASRR